MAISINTSWYRVDFDNTFYPRAHAVAADVDRLRYKLRSFREPLNITLRSVVIPSIKKNFAVEGRPKWAPLSPSTVKSRGSAHPILVRKGKLRRVSAQINIWSIDRNDMEVTGLDRRVPYAKFHQGGTRFMPPRPFMAWYREDVRDTERIFLNWMDRKMRECGFG